MSTVPNPLSYLFYARFKDGTEIIQSDADESAHTPGKSAFFDVLEYQKKTPLVYFELTGPQGSARVNLQTGNFTLNGFNVSPEIQDEVITDRKLVYFRETLQHTTLADGVQPPYIARYFLGYEGKNENGEVVKKFINIEA